MCVYIYDLGELLEIKSLAAHRCTEIAHVLTATQAPPGLQR